ncbi:methyltransferase [Geobacter pelophilus]|uniref:Methyltransferase n=1 Tax=Geoanaerobacter pelophilus TaxID=60036 RepID=A0AAW4L9U5_9BACT|nr:methyltransferase [Geoanaerobacter pelophilus]MBT0666312.1 methyltransferase [Geoanaerobacter pelophilus]
MATPGRATNGTDETLDELRRYSLSLVQPRTGYRYSLDPLLLCAFVAERATGGSLIDLGTGCGIIPLLMTRHYGAASAVGVECQEAMAGLAERNCSLNGSQNHVRILREDILDLRRHFPVSSFDSVLSNPPFRNPGTGKTSPRAGRDIARHETTAGLSDFLSVAKYLVKPGGSIFFVYLPSRLQEFMAVAGELKLAVARLRMVHGTIGAEARIFLAELKKGRKCDLAVEPPLVIYKDDGSYSDEAEQILES